MESQTGSPIPQSIQTKESANLVLLHFNYSFGVSQNDVVDGNLVWFGWLPIPKMSASVKDFIFSPWIMIEGQARPGPTSSNIGRCTSRMLIKVGNVKWDRADGRVCSVVSLYLGISISFRAQAPTIYYYNGDSVSLTWPCGAREETLE